MDRALEDLCEFVRSHTALAPVPLVPEIGVYQATELTPLWHATAADLRGSDESPFWAFPWAGGQALARYLADCPSAARGLCVLDVGTGCGVAAIAAARAGASRVLAYDLDPFCEAAVLLNASENGVAVEFCPGSPFALPLPGPGLILAGDVFYERKLADDFLAFAEEASGRGARILAGDPGRLYSPRGGFAELAAYDVPTSLEIEGRPVLRTRVLELCPRVREGDGPDSG